MADIMARKVTSEVVEHIKRFEGCKLTAYPDPGSENGDPWTIGYGHTSDRFLKVYKGLRITQERADAALDHDLDETAAAVERLVKVDLTDYQFGALVSFVFNIGVEAFQKSTLLRKLNAGDYDAVPAELARWNKNDGKVMAALTNRRAAEAGLWARGAHVASNTVAAEPGNPVKAILKPENLTAAGGLLAGAGGLAAGNGPVQVALAVCLVVAAVAVAIVIVRRATR